MINQNLLIKNIKNGRFFDGLFGLGLFLEIRRINLIRVKTNSNCMGKKSSWKLIHSKSLAKNRKWTEILKKYSQKM